MATYLAKIINDYGIEENLGHFVTDNASNNDTSILLGTDIDCFQEVLQSIEDNEDIGNLTDDRIEQFEQLATTSDIEKRIAHWRKKGAIGKLHNIVIHAMITPQRQELFKLKQQAADPALRDAVDLYVLYQEKLDKSKTSITEDKLTPDDWRELTDFRDLLLPMKEMTKRLEGNAITGSYGALWESLGAMDYLLSTLERRKDELFIQEDTHFRAAIKLSWKKLDDYYTLSDQTAAYQWITTAKSAIRDLWNQYKSRHLITAKQQNELSQFEQYMDGSTQPLQQFDDELDRYLEDGIQRNLVDPLKCAGVLY
ncbi:hypothetical protein B0A49_10531 [Cryomyces minteri]|uniref:Uncharacterized protein n=1 Tax=Cryomyces minteri TaxID=331657 RepID=A0A4U0WXX4_9PEZI|nr:hypothetical protein B0A49_10531 [Cryomyces minteri]